MEANQIPGFKSLFSRWEKTKEDKIDWSLIQPPSPEDIVPYSDLNTAAGKDMLEKLVVLKLNGGLGTSMGCHGPKSAIEVRSGNTFLDLIVQQIEALNSEYGVNVPLVLMNSFNTDRDTAAIVDKYKDRVRILTFNQSRYPRLRADNHMPVATSASDPMECWYPPGHGDCYQALKNSGVLDTLRAEGKKYLFFSNADNLGATVDLKILHSFASTGAEFFMELTDKTRADVKGGTLIRYKDSLKLLEVAQVPPEHVPEFKTITKFKVFNTNNLWVTLDAVAEHADSLAMEVITNPKKYGDIPVIQLETAAGAALQFFKVTILSLSLSLSLSLTLTLAFSLLSFSLSLYLTVIILPSYVLFPAWTGSQRCQCTPHALPAGQDYQ
eukprot:TRINITY_DN437_c0_g1_i9.p1 TRINITY_DN437_c0_g1~~TRINITY_DN437_c0_g1_i9.p1  ORF type:complete len:422 (+),score=117.94 TRINITY_DN437_c0_g1_i9:122-1267(+)